MPAKHHNQPPQRKASIIIWLIAIALCLLVTLFVLLTSYEAKAQTTLTDVTTQSATV